MLNLHLLECTVKGYDHISDLLFAKYWVITGCKYYNCTSLVKCYCYATIPPVLNESSFGNIAQEAILYVPIGCKSAYEASDWTNYFETIVEMN